MAIKKKSRKSESGFGSYIHKVCKQVHPDLQVSRKAMAAVASLLDSAMASLTKNGVLVAAASKKGTLSARHIQSATKLVIPGEMARHAVSEGSKAVAKFTS